MSTPRYVDRRLVFTCDLERNVGTAQLSDGFIDDVWSSVGTSVPCMYWESQERYIDESIGPVTIKSRNVMFRHDQDLKMDDRLSNLQDRDGFLVGVGTAAILEPATRRDIKGSPAFQVAKLEKVETN